MFGPLVELTIESIGGHVWDVFKIILAWIGT